jgi:aerobic-type carbon monoxide dehydrogenase small subunit (CoxS/CutS family)
MTLRLGQRGANLGCDRAQCGACNVILDGRAVNSCAQLTARLNGSSVRTAASLATGPGMVGLHPLQRVFWEEGAFQCGICTKGYLMTSLALLERNPSPTPDEVTEALSGILCRCGEQDRIIKAVVRAAAEMRYQGQVPPPRETLMPHTSDVLGTRVPRIHGREQLTDEGDFVSLMSLPNQVFVKTLRSPYARARVLRVEATAAEQMPGVVRVLHAHNLPEPYRSIVIESPPERRLLNTEVIHVGMPVAVVAAESEHIAEDALARIEVEYEVLEPATDFEKAAGYERQWENLLPGTVRKCAMFSARW